MAKTYILQKDIPDAKTGDKYVWNGQGYSNVTRIACAIAKHWVEREEFFKEQPERIEVSGFHFIEENDWNGNKDCKYCLATRQRIPEEKFKEIKEAVACVLDNDFQIINEPVFKIDARLPFLELIKSLKQSAVKMDEYEMACNWRMVEKMLIENQK